MNISKFLLCAFLLAPACSLHTKGANFKEPTIGITIESHSKNYDAQLRKFFKIPNNPKLARKDEQYIELYIVGGYFGGFISYLIFSDPPSFYSRSSVDDAIQLVKADSEEAKIRLTSFLKHLNEIMTNNDEGKFVGGADMPDSVVFTHNLEGGDKIFIMRGFPRNDKSIFGDDIAALLGCVTR